MTFVVLLTVTEVGEGAMDTLVAAPAFTVRVVVPHELAPFFAVMIGVSAVSSP